MKKKIRFLSALLALALCLSCMALPAFAEEETPVMPQPGECTCTYHCSDTHDIELGARGCQACYHYMLNLTRYYHDLNGWQAPLPWDEIHRLVSAACTGEGANPCLCVAPGECYYYTNEGRKLPCVPCARVEYEQGKDAIRPCGGSGSGFAASSAVSSGKSAPDVSGNYRTTSERLREKLDPVEIAQQELNIDPVTNTIVNLYDADGNLITATLSSDGHFYIVPDSSGEFVYIPTGK